MDAGVGGASTRVKQGWSWGLAMLNKIIRPMIGVGGWDHRQNNIGIVKCRAGHS